MSRYSLAHLLDGEVVRGLETNLAKERDALADVLAHIAEVEVRKLYVPAGYESMHDYCMRGLHLSKDSAYKRIRAAKTASEHPMIFEKVAEGSLRLTSLLILASYLTSENVGELLAAAAFKTDFEVKEILAERFPQAPVTTTIEPLPQQQGLDAGAESGADPSCDLAAQPIQGVVNPPQVMPLATDLYKLSFTMTGAMYAKLQQAVNLFGRRKPVPDEAEILELGLDLLVQKLEKKKFCATDKPRPRKPCAKDHIPAEVQREVWERDDGQCTFHSDDGTRCAAKMDLQYDHIIPEARGGRSDDKDNLRLRCHAHNQYEAERAFGKPFMEGKRERAKAERARREAEREMRRAEQEARRAAKDAERAAREERKAAEKAANEALDNDEATPWLRGLGLTKDEARYALTQCGPTPELDLQGRIKRCLAVMVQYRRLVRPA